MSMSGDQVRAAFEDAGAILSGHFVLTSGRHSGTYLQCARVLEDTVLTMRLAQELASRFADSQVDIVASPAVGGIVIGFAVGAALEVPFVFSEREDGRMRLRRGFEIPAGARVLVVEDVVTTGGSVAEVLDLVEESGAETVGVACLVDRGGPKAFDAPLVSLMALDVTAWDPDECPQCAAAEPKTSPGSRRLS